MNLLVWSNQNGKGIAGGLNLLRANGLAILESSLLRESGLGGIAVVGVELKSCCCSYIFSLKSLGFFRSLVIFISLTGRDSFFSVGLIVLDIFSSCIIRFSSSKVQLYRCSTFFSKISSLDIGLTSNGIVTYLNLNAITLMLSVLFAITI